ncbi:hypothetical protein NDU88_005125 [Pleurodeles waltl]|uniref:Uncharacterized protein n=1 Tax=Pleurodeles waltl TaxID=8319 RepID=A0AAV7PG05_PLEWA|nr:hypothetical protein NDU88_005125 [Pleurodeles waltl]
MAIFLAWHQDVILSRSSDDFIILQALSTLRGIGSFVGTAVEFCDFTMHILDQHEIVGMNVVFSHLSLPGKCRPLTRAPFLFWPERALAPPSREMHDEPQWVGPPPWTRPPAEDALVGLGLLPPATARAPETQCTFQLL